MNRPSLPAADQARGRSRRTILAAVTAVVIATVLLAVVLLTGGPSGEDPGAQGRRAPDRGTSAPSQQEGPRLPRLTWPPPDTRGYERVDIAEPGTVRLDDDKDYVLESSQTIDGPVVLRGGRNIVWVGGHIRILDAGKRAGSTARRALVVQDGEEARQGRVVHLEGLLIDGPDLSEGIDTNAPQAILQVQNCRILGVHFRSEDDLEGRGDYDGPNHPDIVQTWGSVGELRIDGLTGTSAYQGLFLKADKNRPHGPVWLRRVDLKAVAHRGGDGQVFVGHRLLFWDPAGTGPLRIDSGTVWIDHDPRSRWGTQFGDNVHPPTSSAADVAADVGRDVHGTYVTWHRDVTLDNGAIAVRDFSGRHPGLVYSGPPPGGSYVPDGVAGLRYQTPGYRF